MVRTVSPLTGLQQLLFVVRVGTRLGAGKKARSQHCGLRPQSQDGNHSARVSDAARGGDRPWGDGIDHARDQGKGRDLPDNVATRLDALRDDDIHPRVRRPAGFRDRADLMEDLHANRVGTLHVWGRITPEEGEDGHALFQADRDLVFDGKVEEQVHPERLGRERPHAMDLLAEDRRRAELRLQDAKAARVAHRGDELWAGQVGTHRRGDDGVLDPQHVA
jgi:hypothetical protein